MITSLIQMLELPNFGHMAASTIKFESILLATSRTGVMTSEPLFQNTFILRIPRVANFADIIKNSAILTKNIFEDSKEFVRSGISALKCNLNLYFS